MAKKAKKKKKKTLSSRIVKRRGQKEPFDEKKIYASVYAAALNCHYSEQESEKIAKAVTIKVKKWIATKKSVDSREIRDIILKNISDHHVELMYRHHLDVC